MKIKSILALVGLVGVSSLSYAQIQLSGDKPAFIGIGNLAVTESFAPKILADAIRSGNEEQIENWRKERGFSFPYDNSKICLISITSFFPHSSDYDFKPGKTAGHGKAINSGIYPYATSCDRLPLMIASSRYNGEYAPSIFKYMKSPYYKAELAEETQKQTNLINMFIDELQDDQWSQLIGVITSNDLDFNTRKKALAKFENLYIAKGGKMTPIQKEFVDAARENYKTSPSITTINAEYFWVAEDPIHYLFIKAFNNFVSLSRFASQSKAYKEGVVPKIGVDYFTGKEKINIDEAIKKAIASDMYPHQKESYIKSLYEAEILKSIMQLKGLDVNKQDLLGNTFLHISFRSSHGGHYEGNGMAANLIRALLEMGANPMLLNKDNASSYMVFKETYGNNSDYKIVLNAYEMNPYVDQ